MGLYTGVFKTVRITDRTVPEVLGRNRALSGNDSFGLLSMLKRLGADLLEITPEVLKTIGVLPDGIDYLYRIGKEHDLRNLSATEFKKIVLSSNTPGVKELLRSPVLNDRTVTLECRVESAEDVIKLKDLKDIGWPGNVKTIRLLGLNGVISSAWTEAAVEIKRTLAIKLDICPENLFYNATAAAIDGMRHVADRVTASFAGYGGVSGYAALEQVLTFVKTLTDPYAPMELDILPELAACFSECTGIRIPGNMPVIGGDIFRYESGIHADGICKNPATYEPYDPAAVGQQRRLSIGKHSGRKSVLKKLHELGIEAGDEQAAELLRLIREKSISLRRDLQDEEIIGLLQVRTAAV